MGSSGLSFEQTVTAPEPDYSAQIDQALASAGYTGGMSDENIQALAASPGEGAITGVDGQPAVLADTLQCGFTVSVNVGPYAVSVSAGISGDTEGNTNGYFTTTAGIGNGTSIGASGGVSIAGSNAATNFDLEGMGMQTSIAVGPVSVDMSTGTGQNGQKIVSYGATIGPGFKGEYSTSAVTTSVSK